MTRGRPWPPEVRAEALRRVADGETLKAIGEAVGVPDSTIEAWRDLAGIRHPKPRSGWRIEVRTEALRRVADGESPSSVERALGVPGRTLERWRAAAAAKAAPRSEWHRKRPHIKSERIVRESALMLEGLISSFALVDPKALDLDAARPWVASMAKSLSELNRFVREITQCDNKRPPSAELDRPDPPAN